MSKFYNPHRSRNLYDPGSDKPFKISRSKIDLFVACPRCFYIDRRLGTGRPPGFPFNINSAVDTLLKKEFDVHRAAGTAHPLQTAHGLNAIPAPHEQINEWRENFKGVQHLHEPTNLIITGAIDDLWIDGEVPDARRRKVLEKVCALGRFYDEVLETCFDDHPGSGVLVPRIRNAEMRIR